MVFLHTIIIDIIIQRFHSFDGSMISDPVNSNSLDNYFTRATNGSHRSGFVVDPIIYYLS
jgi:hypothetical protein